MLTIAQKGQLQRFNGTQLWHVSNNFAIAELLHDEKGFIIIIIIFQYDCYLKGKYNVCMRMQVFVHCTYVKELISRKWHTFYDHFF